MENSTPLTKCRSSHLWWAISSTPFRKPISVFVYKLFTYFRLKLSQYCYFMSCRSLYFYAHIWSVLLILFCRMRGTKPRPTEKPQKDESTVEMNKNWIDKLEHKGGSAEVNYSKRVKLN